MTRAALQSVVATAALLLVLQAATGSIAASPIDPLDGGIEQARRAADDGQPTRALAQMQAVLQDEPNSARAHFVTAQLYQQLGRADDARIELSRARAIAPQLPFAADGSALQLQRALASAPGASAPLGSHTPHHMPLALAAALAALAGAMLAWAVMRVLRPRCPDRAGTPDPVAATPLSTANRPRLRSDSPPRVR